MNDLDDGGVVELITRHQVAIYGYIVSLLYRSQDAQDVLQETNLVLREKRAEAPKGSEFLSWACTVGCYQVLSYSKRNRHSRLFFSDDVIKDVAATIAERPGLMTSKHEALQQCLQRLPSQSRALLKPPLLLRIIRGRNGSRNGAVDQGSVAITLPNPKAAVGLHSNSSSCDGKGDWVAETKDLRIRGPRDLKQFRNRVILKERSLANRWATRSQPSGPVSCVAAITPAGWS